MINSDYLYTNIYTSIAEFKPQDDSLYFYGYSMEQRSHAIDTHASNDDNSKDYIEIKEIDENTVYVDLTQRTYLLRSSSQIQELLTFKNRKTVYIDVTGLDNRVCASFINNGINLIENSYIENLIVVYAEPQSYKIHEFKTEGVFNDLSEKINGIKPLPGFASVFPDDIDNTKLVALLGFEGGRFAHILDVVQPPRDNVIPIIGVPGYRMEYPHYTYLGNIRPLSETDTWRRIKYASANSFVEIYQLLSKIIKDNIEEIIKIAPIGTKPHAIGAILTAIKYPHNVELVYDNPKRTKQRTEGVGRIIECFASKLLDES